MVENLTTDPEVKGWNQAAGWQKEEKLTEMYVYVCMYVCMYVCLSVFLCLAAGFDDVHLIIYVDTCPHL